MKIKITTLFVATLVLGRLPGLLAQASAPGAAPNPNLGNVSGAGSAQISNASLVATTADGRDVSSGLTVPVGQPIPTVTFTLGGSGLPTIGSWSAVLAPNLPTFAEPLPYYGIAPGLEIVGSTAGLLNNSAVAQLAGTPTQTGIFDIALAAATTANFSGSASSLSGGSRSQVFEYIIIVTALAAPSFTVNPVSVTIASGRSAAFSAAASGELAPTYQWNLNGVPISGATDPVLLVSAATSANAGTYTCTANNASGIATSASATLTVATASSPGYLVNLSARADIGTGNNILIGGFGISGSGSKQLLLRGVGPGLFDTFALSGELVTPELNLLDDNGALIAGNIGWANSPILGPSAGADSPQAAPASTMTTLGAFAYQAGSADTALAVTAPTGNNTAQVSGVGSTSGIGLVEIYDADTGTPTAHLVNLSARANVGTANNILIGGFAIGGSTAETVLIRAVGPGLTDTFGLTGTLTQPVLTVLQSGTALYTNTVWGGDVTIAGVFPTVGAFNLNAAHQDSVLLVTLPPGNYTAQVSGLNNGTGIALCEIYEVQ